MWNRQREAEEARERLARAADEEMAPNRNPPPVNDPALAPAAAGVTPARRYAVFCSLKPSSRDHLLAHHEFLHLAGDGHGEGVDEADVARDLVVRDLALAEGADLLGGRRCARLAA